MPLNMKSDALGRFPTWYMQMYHTQHIELVKPEEDSDLTDLSERESNLNNKKKSKRKLKINVRIQI